MDDPGTAAVILEVIAVVLFIIINALCELTESALVSVDKNIIKDMATQGNKRGKKALTIIEHPIGFVVNSQINIVFSCALASAVAIVGFEPKLSNALIKSAPNASKAIMIILSVFIITFIVSVINIIFGNLIPKRLAKHIPEKIILRFATLMMLNKIILKPLAMFSSSISNGIVKLLGYDPHKKESKVTEEKIRKMVDDGEETGVIENTQKEMINNIFKFDDMCVDDIMTHRTDIIAVEDKDKLTDVVALAIEHGYSRIPVFEEDLDNIIGVVYIKDLLKYVGENFPKTKKVKDVMHPAFYVPETRNCDKLFRDLNERHLQLAIVVDEYGGTAGIVTLEDLLESIVGNIQDEYDQEDEPMYKVSEKVYILDGSADVEDIEEGLDIEIPEGDYDTIGGFVISLLGYLPKYGDKDEAKFKNIRFTVLNVEDRRINKIKAEFLEKINTEEE